MRMVIHPGFPKSATTLLQSIFEAEVPGISYLGKFNSGISPNEEISRWADPLLFEAVEWCRGNRSDPCPAPESLNRAIRDIDERSSGDIAPKVHVLSDERLSKPGISPDWRQSMADRMHHLFPDAHVLLTIRNQESTLNSLFGMYLRYQARQRQTDAVLVFADWLEGDGFGRTSFSDRLDYGLFYDVFANVFGLDRVHVVPYEFLQSEPQRFVQSVATALGIPELELNLSMIVNPRPKSDELSILAASCRLPPRLRFRSLSRLVAPLFVSRQGLEMGENEQRHLEDQFGESNRRLAERTGLDLDAMGYPVASMTER